MGLRLITAATAACVKSTEALTWIRGSSRLAEVDLLTAQIKTAERYAENWTKRAIMGQTWRLTMDAIPSDDIIELPRPPLQTPATNNVTFTYTDTTGGSQTMPSTCYTIDAESEPARIYRAYDADWPTDIRSHKDVITIEYNVGVTASSLVDERFKTWMKFRIGAMYENREAAIIGSGNFLTEMPRAYVDGLLDELCVITVY